MLAATANLFASEYYASNVAEINSALSLVQPGDTIVMRNGIWQNSEIKFIKNGTADKPILLRAETAGSVILTGSSSLKIAGQYLVVDGLYFIDGYLNSGSVIEFRNGSNHSSYCRLTNTAIINYNPPNKSTDYKWVSLYGTNNRVDHCYFRGKTHSGTTLVVWLSGQPNYHLIDHNYFGNRPELGANGGETIRVGTSDWSMYDSYTTVEYNYFEACDGEAEIISNKSCENTYRYNTFYRCSGTLTLRHGNRCYVYGNFFFGEKKSGTGGVRIIGEDHKVFNNYFYQLDGNGYRSALSIVNGIPASPLSGYYQVKNAIVAFNTFVDNRYTFEFGSGKSSTQSLPPENCIIANNVVRANVSPIFRFVDQPINTFYEGNIVYGANVGITNPVGITVADPKLFFAEDSLWRIGEGSPAIGAASGNYDFVTVDMDGQIRNLPKDAGADQFSSDPIIYRPMKPADVGPKWLADLNTDPRVKPVQAGVDSLTYFLQNAISGDILELVTDGGIYSNTSNLEINVPVTIRAKDGLKNPPVLLNNSDASSKSIIEIKNGGSLNLSGVILDGLAGSSTPAKYLIRTDDEQMPSSYKLIAEGCTFKDVVSGSDGNFFRAYPGTFADTIKFSNCLFTNSGKEGIRLKDEASQSGKYNVKYFEVSNSTFWNIPKEAITIYAGDDNPGTPGPKVFINHVTFDNCGYDNSSIVYAKEVDGAEIRSCIFSNSPGNEISIRLDGTGSKILYSDIYNVGPLSLNRTASIGSGMLYVDPLYADPQNGNFTLAQNSPVRGKAFDFTAMGDLRWQNDPTDIDDQQLIPQVFLLHQNFPNPFNPSTTIKYSVPVYQKVSIKIFDVLGNEAAVLVDEIKSPGEYNAEFNAAGFSSGIYYYRMTAGNYSETKKMILLK